MSAVKSAGEPRVRLAGGRFRRLELQARKTQESIPADPDRTGGRPSWNFSQTAVTPPLILGAMGDQLEHAAERSASTSAGSAIGVTRAHAPSSGQIAPTIVTQALAAPGRLLDGASRARFESRYGHDFSAVRVHANDHAARSARAIGAAAYTVGDHIVLGQGGPTPSLLAHELAHVVQQSGAPWPWVQRQPAAAATAAAMPPAPRKSFVFLMGADAKRTTNPFYAMAARYFHAHVPTATFVDDKRSLGDMLAWLSANVSAPIGDLYIVSHGNEDGTLAFGLTGSADGGHMSVVELREALHPQAGGPSSLTSVSSLIDATTKIHIKGCDIGRTQEMVELIDEAFGGAGEVTAPTHEQGYYTDPTLGGQARAAAHDSKIATFTAGLPALPPAPTPVDKKLKGDALKQAKADFAAATQALKTAKGDRKIAIAEEEKRIKPELDATAEEADTIDSLSGPMFQRPGTKLFKAAELQPQIDSLYGHLSEAQRKSMAKRLVAPDRGVAGDQQGQKVVTVKPFSETFDEPASLAEAKTAFAGNFKDEDFTPKTMTATAAPGAAGGDMTFTFEGSKHPKSADAFDTTMPLTTSRDDDVTIIDGGKEKTNNPDRYQWRVERKHAKSGKTTLTAIGERVTAYLHHGSLDAKPHDHFGQPESSADFYATSTFAPPPPPPPPAPTGP